MDVSIWLVSDDDRAGVLRESYLSNNILFEHPVEMLGDLPLCGVCRRCSFVEDVSILSCGIRLGFSNGQLAVYCILEQLSVIIQHCS